MTLIATASKPIGSFLVHAIATPWHLRWGATDDEVAMELPGDWLVPRAEFVATRAVTIEARPEAIWPWIVQIGYGRAGFYADDLLDNLGRPSADRIL